MDRRTVLRKGALASTVLFTGCPEGPSAVWGSRKTTTAPQTDCTAINPPDSPVVTPGSEEFFSKMLGVVRTLGKPWRKTQIELSTDMSDNLRNQAVDLLLPGIRDTLLPDSVSAVQSLIEATVTSYDTVAAAGEALLIGEFRGAATSVKPRAQYREFERPFDGEPTSEVTLVSATDPTDRPFYTLTNVLEENIIGLARGEIDSNEAREDAIAVHEVVETIYLEQIDSGNFTVTGLPLAGCGSKYSGTDARVAALLLNLELLGVCARIIVNATKTSSQNTPTAVQQRTERATPSSEIGRILAEYEVDVRLTFDDGISDVSSNNREVHNNGGEIVDGFVGNGLKLTPPTDHITVESGLDSPSSPEDEPFTYLTWIKLHSHDTRHNIFSNYGDRRQLYISSDGAVCGRMWGGGGRIEGDSKCGGQVPIEEWHHVGFVFTGSEGHLYLDGQSVAEGSWQGYSGGPQTCIGSEDHGSTGCTVKLSTMDATIDEWTIITEAVPAETIRAIATI